MEFVSIGEANLQLSRIAFGAWAIGGWLWGGADKDEALRAIEASIDCGMSSFDTAPVYGFGQSEELIGQALKGKRDKVQILTKYGLRWDLEKGHLHMSTQDNDGNPRDVLRVGRKDSIIAECEASLKRLQTDYIDLYQIHWPDPLTPISETMEAMEILLQQGKIRAVGVCNYSKSQTEEAEKYIALASNQVPYSMLRRDIEAELVPHCLESGTAILAYSPLQRGLLTGKITPDYVFNEGDTRPKTTHFQKENIKRTNDFLNKIKPIADAHKSTLAQLVIRWTLEQPAIAVALVGARNAKQAIENAQAIFVGLAADELQTINEALDKFELVS